jgi:hypothetical protein
MAGAAYFMGRIFPTGKMLRGARRQYDRSLGHDASGSPQRQKNEMTICDY